MSPWHQVAVSRALLNAGQPITRPLQWPERIASCCRKEAEKPCHVETVANFVGWPGHVNGRHRQVGPSLVSARLAEVFKFCQCKGWLGNASSSRSARLWHFSTHLLLPFGGEIAGT